MNKYDLQHLRNFGALQRKINAIYNAAAEEAAAIGQLIPTLPAGAIFAFKDYPITHDRIRELLQYIYAQTFGTIENGINVEWALANDKNDALVWRIFGDVSTLTKQQQRKYLTNNDDARMAFISRQTEGLNLSERVWRYANEFKSEIELGLDIGIRDGRDARGMARDLKQYLQHPDKLFRRVRDAHGNLQLSKAAAAFHPGRGVYRSSYKNALRLAATETNMAYRTADQERWKDFDFVVGQRVCLSPTNHPVADICDELKGEYPKDFKFVGWHPHCRCYVESILKSDKELKDDTRRIIRGEQPTDSTDSANAVRDTPPNFDAWVKDNQWRIEHAKTPPYFIRDNRKRVDNILNGKEQAQTAKHINTPQEVAAERHAARTPEDVETIQKAWRQKLIRDITLESARYGDNALMDGYIKSMRDNRIIGDGAAFTSDYNNARKLLATLRRENTSALTFAKEQMKRFAEMETAMKTKRGVPMTLREADMQSANPDYKYNSPYSINCQTCAPTYVLRSQGFPVVATGNTPGSVQEWISCSHSFDIWENIDGTPAKPTLYRDWLDAKGFSDMSAKRYKSFFEGATTEPGIYIATIAWKGGGAHATIIQRFADGTLAYIEPQHFNGTMKRSIDELCNGGKTKIPTWSKRGIMRVDDKMLKRICRDSGKDYDIWSIFGIK